MKSLRRLGAFSLISAYVLLLLPGAAFAQSAPRPTCQITATPSVISPGGTITLRWSSTNATAGAITHVGNVAPNGSQQILPSLAQITTYVGSFTGPGGTANCTASVQVNYGTTGGTGSAGGGTAIDNQPTPIVPNPVNGGVSQPNTTDRVPDGLVQCGRGSGIQGATNCQACELARLVQNIINFLIGLSIPIAAVLFAWAGVLYFSSGANESNISKAKDIFKNAFIGFLITISAWLVVNTLLHALLDGGQLFKGGASWFKVDCTGNRPVNLKFNDLINSVLPRVNTNPIVSVADRFGTPVATCGTGYSLVEGTCYNDITGDARNPAYSYNTTGTAGLCPSGYNYTEDANEYWCQNPNDPNDWEEARAQREYSRGYIQCNEGNTNCNVDSLRNLGLTDAQANAMSCIAMTESSGVADRCSGTGPCGTFQISQTNWGMYASPGCSAAAFDGNIRRAQNNAQCNMQTMATMVRAQGYQPWTGNLNGVYWNPAARTCVANYDPTNLR